MLKTLIFVVSFSLIIISCAHNLKTDKEKPLVTLYKEANQNIDADLNFEKDYFWKNNKENQTFIMQNFSLIQYNNIIDEVKKMKFIGNENPKYYPHINYAFVVYKES